MKTCVLIPSFNGARTIGAVVKGIKEKGLDAVVIDDGSRDDTERRASESGAIVIRNASNLGKGASLKRGFRFILSSTNFDAVIIMDGDGQHSPDDIQKFIAGAENGVSDVIVGNRMNVVKNMPFVRLATNKLMSYLLSVRCKQDIPDTQCGFKLIKRDVLKKIKLESSNYDLDSELLIEASRNKFKIASVRIETIYRDEPSRIHPIKDTLRFFALFVKSYLK